MTHSIPIFPAALMTAIEILSLCTSIPIYLVLVMKGVFLSGAVEPNTQNLLQKGRPLYCVVPPRSSKATRSSLVIGVFNPTQALFQSITVRRQKTRSSCGIVRIRR
jgi:hypothetical protein